MVQQHNNETNLKNQLNLDLTLEIDTENNTLTNNTKDNKKYRHQKSIRIFWLLVQNTETTDKYPSNHELTTNTLPTGF